MSDGISSVLEELHHEVARAQGNFPAFNSVMEAEAVIREEMDELTKAIRKWYRPEAPMGLCVEIEDEALHVAAMAIRLLVEGRVPVMERDE